MKKDFGLGFKSWFKLALACSKKTIKEDMPPDKPQEKPLPFHPLNLERKIKAKPSMRDPVKKWGY